MRGQCEITSEEKLAVMRAHVNLGHPPHRDFLRFLQGGPVRLRVLQYVASEFNRPACEAHRLPKAPLPAKIPRNYDFNIVVGIDCFKMDVLPKKAQWNLNIVCWGTTLQIVCPMGAGESPSARSVWRLLS